jgi:phosphohistidine phosphatase SixA
MQPSPELYEASAEALRRAADAAGGDTVLVCGHNPAVGALAAALAQACAIIAVEARTALAAGFPTATAAAFEFVDGRTGCVGVFGAQGPLA